MYNCVADDNVNGVQARTGAGQIIGCRITNNSAYGIEGDSVWHDPYTFYGGNDANWEFDLGVDLIDGVSTRTIDAGSYGDDFGYIVEPTGEATLPDRNYGLTNQATARRQEVTL